MPDLRTIFETIEARGPTLDADAYARYHQWSMLKSFEDVEGLSECVSALRTSSGDLSDSLTADLETHKSSDPIPHLIPLPEMTLDEARASDFVDTMNIISPFIIREALKSSEAVKQWTPEFFIERYGDFQCPMHKRDTPIMGTLGEATQDILRAAKEHDPANSSNKPKSLQIQGEGALFMQFPELQSQIGVQGLIQSIKIPLSKIFVSQMFFGGPGTGTSFHCANWFNVFTNIYGTKRWHLAHPKHSAWFSGRLDSTGMYGEASQDTNELDKDGVPLLGRVIPMYTATLEPGDVLVNPPWWWHKVSNLGVSMGLANRYQQRNGPQRRSLFDFLQVLHPQTNTRAWPE